jgi:hypothetical protein
VVSAGMSDCPPLAGRCDATVILFRDRPAVPSGTDRPWVCSSSHRSTLGH